MHSASLRAPFLPLGSRCFIFPAMFCSSVFWRVGAIVLLVLLAACMPSSDGILDEQKDPHYLNGRARVTALDYKGAMEEFSKALETNPRSASAHLELAWLCEQTSDYAAAIYHYERHLKLRPDSEYGERARDRVKSCKMELVRSEVIGPVNQGVQRDLERFMTENMLLKQRVESLEAQLSTRVQMAASTTPSASLPQRAAVPVQPYPAQQHVAEPAGGPAVAPRPAVAPVQPAAARARRTHVVKSGDKLTTIAREYGVDLGRLMHANPGIDPTRLKIGQTIHLP